MDVGTGGHHARTGFEHGYDPGNPFRCAGSKRDRMGLPPSDKGRPAHKVHLSAHPGIMVSANRIGANLAL
jgi:hypothetical protein